MKVSIKAAAQELGVRQETLRRWEQAGKITAERTAGGHRRYDLAVLRKVAEPLCTQPPERVTIGYARVSSQDQLPDLQGGLNRTPRRKWFTISSDYAVEGSYGTAAIAGGHDGYSLEGCERHAVKYAHVTKHEEGATLTTEKSDVAVRDELMAVHVFVSAKPPNHGACSTSAGLLLVVHDSACARLALKCVRAVC